MTPITSSQFIGCFISLILGGRDLPKKQLDLHVLLISSILRIDPNRQYSESELNGELRIWATNFGGNFGLDHVTLRRFLIDYGYIRRDAAGTAYELESKDLPFAFDPSIADLDLEEMIDKAREEREKRKQQYISGRKK